MWTCFVSNIEIHFSTNITYSLRKCFKEFSLSVLRFFLSISLPFPHTSINHSGRMPHATMSITFGDRNSDVVNLIGYSCTKFSGHKYLPKNLRGSRWSPIGQYLHITCKLNWTILLRKVSFCYRDRITCFARKVGSFDGKTGSAIIYSFWNMCFSDEFEFWIRWTIAALPLMEWVEWTGWK